MKKTENKIPLFDLKITPETKKEINAVLESGWLTGGEKVIAFENEIAKLLNMKYSVAVNSCTTALQLVLSAVGANNLREVITSPFTFVGTIEAIKHTGARVIFADIDPNTLNIDPDEVARKVTSHTIAIVPVDIAGYPADYYRLNKISDEFSIPIISDSAHAIGSKYKNKPIPHHTDASVYSFYSTKNLTCGEGGIIVSKHKALIDALRILSRHGITTSTYERSKKQKWEYDIAHLGFKANMSELHAAVGLGQLSAFIKDQAKREKIAQRYIENLSDYEQFFELPHLEKNVTHGWHLFIIRLHLSKLKINRKKFISSMADKNIECGVHYIPIFEFDYYRKALGFTDQYLPNAAYAGKRVVTLPFYPSMKLNDVDRVCETMLEIFKKSKK